jgi:hypothetical protein
VVQGERYFAAPLDRSVYPGAIEGQTIVQDVDLFSAQTLGRGAKTPGIGMSPRCEQPPGGFAQREERIHESSAQVRVSTTERPYCLRYP